MSGGNSREAGFALLDDSSNGAGAARSRLYTGLIRQVACVAPSGLDAACAEVRDALRSGCSAVVLIDYEFGVRMHGASAQERPGQLVFLLFEQCRDLEAHEVDEWLAAHDPGQEISVDGPPVAPGVAGIGDLQTDTSRDEFGIAIDRIQQWLRAGECYQINYTYRLNFDAFGSPVALYRRLRARQPVPFGALIMLPDEAGSTGHSAGRAILSLSPELFVQHRDGELTARPMKGTAPAHTGAHEQERNCAAAAELAADEKNRAENLMIVDLLRNDLSRLAVPGSVSVPALFCVERFAEVLQMTSTVRARLRPGTGFADVLRALFPCGSITGAPKYRTMQLIETLEKTPRGLYTGAIGWLDSPREAGSLGDFCLSVAIRTLALDAPRADGVRRGQLGVGAGIVLDSEADSEWAECRLKANFLSAMDPGFALFETMYATRAEGVRYLDWHLERLQRSAAYFGFVCDVPAVRTAVAARCSELPAGRACRLRLALQRDGATTLTHGVLTPLPARLKVLLDPATALVNADALWLRHKTTVRARYDQAWRAAETLGAFDQLFFNQRGELTEGARSNIFVKLRGAWLTPPVSSGLLPGVMRRAVLADPAWNAREAVLMRDDLLNAQALMVCNALRGAVPAELVVLGG